MKKVELHFHTDESSRCGKVPAKDGVRMYIEQGYAGLAVTDHFSEYACGKEGPWRISAAVSWKDGGWQRRRQKCRERIPGIFRNGDPLSS